MPDYVTENKRNEIRLLTENNRNMINRPFGRLAKTHRRRRKTGQSRASHFRSANKGFAEHFDYSLPDTFKHSQGSRTTSTFEWRRSRGGGCGAIELTVEIEHGRSWLLIMLSFADILTENGV